MALSTLGAVLVLVVTSFSLWSKADRLEKSMDTRLGQIETRLGQVADKVGKAAAARPASGPDPAKVYTLNVANSPARGPASAPVTIAEFSDFQ